MSSTDGHAAELPHVYAVSSSRDYSFLVHHSPNRRSGLFTDRVYDKRYYDTNEGGHSYQEYAAGKLPKARQPSGNGGILNMQILRRGRSKRVDVFLDWLVRIARTASHHITDESKENGAFEALRAGHLRALQVYIHPDVDSRDKILERYTFTISYTHHGPSQKTPTGLRLDSPGQACVSVQATSNALRAMLCDLSQVGNVLPALPGMSTPYNEVVMTRADGI